MDPLTPFLVSPERIGWLVRWLSIDVFRLENIIQVPALILTGGIAWLLCRPVQRRISVWIRQLSEHQRLDWLVLHRVWLINRLVPLITPTAWVIGLWISVSVAEHTGWPDAVARVVMNLLLAWLVIRLAADLVPN